MFPLRSRTMSCRPSPVMSASRTRGSARVELPGRCRSRRRCAARPSAGSGSLNQAVQPGAGAQHVGQPVAVQVDQPHGRVGQPRPPGTAGRAGTSGGSTRPAKVIGKYPLARRPPSAAARAPAPVSIRSGRPSPSASRSCTPGSASENGGASVQRGGAGRTGRRRVAPVPARLRRRARPRRAARSVQVDQGQGGVAQRSGRQARRRSPLEPAPGRVEAGVVEGQRRQAARSPGPAGRPPGRRCRRRRPGSAARRR